MERLVNIFSHPTETGRTIRGRWQVGVGALVLFLALLASAAPARGVPSVSATLTPGAFAVDEGATLTVTIEDGKGDIERMPEVEGLIFERRGQSRQHRIVNGSMTSSLSTIFEVQATRPGTFTIGPITLRVDGQSLATEPIGLTVSPAVGQGMDQIAFLRLDQVKGQGYLGELLPVEIKVWFRHGLRAGLDRQPRVEGDGLLLNLDEQEPRQSEEVIDGTGYAVLTWIGSLSGIKEGRQPLRVAVDATILVPAGSGRRGGSVAGDPFFGNDPVADFFNQRPMREKKVRLLSPETTVTVLPLPSEGRPEDFSGAIGRFTLDVTAQPTEVEPGDPITLTMTVQGSGNFDRVEAPVFSANGNWKRYTPTSRSIPGGKVFEQAIIPRDSAITAIPSVSFSFFDPEGSGYQTLHSAPIPVSISRDDNAGRGGDRAADNGRQPGDDSHQAGEAPDAPAPLDASRQVAGQLPGGPPAVNGSNLVQLEPETGSRPRHIFPPMGRPWLLLVALLAVLLVISVMVLKMRARRRAADPRLQRQQEMTTLLDRQVREIGAASHQGDPRAFLALCRRVMQEQLGALWGMEPAAITLADLRRHLAADAALITLFATAENSAYGGCRLGEGEMGQYASRLEEELRRLF